MPSDGSGINTEVILGVLVAVPGIYLGYLAVGPLRETASILRSAPRNRAVFAGVVLACFALATAIPAADNSQMAERQAKALWVTFLGLTLLVVISMLDLVAASIRSRYRHSQRLELPIWIRPHDTWVLGGGVWRSFTNRVRRIYSHVIAFRDAGNRDGQTTSRNAKSDVQIDQSNAGRIKAKKDGKGAQRMIEVELDRTVDDGDNTGSARAAKARKESGREELHPTPGNGDGKTASLVFEEDGREPSRSAVDRGDDDSPTIPDKHRVNPPRYMRKFMATGASWVYDRADKRLTRRHTKRLREPEWNHGVGVRRGWVFPFLRPHARDLRVIGDVDSLWGYHQDWLDRRSLRLKAAVANRPDASRRAQGHRQFGAQVGVSDAVELVHISSATVLTAPMGATPTLNVTVAHTGDQPDALLNTWEAAFEHDREMLGVGPVQTVSCGLVGIGSLMMFASPGELIPSGASATEDSTAEQSPNPASPSNFRADTYTSTDFEVRRGSPNLLLNSAFEEHLLVLGPYERGAPPAETMDRRLLQAAGRIARCSQQLRVPLSFLVAPATSVGATKLDDVAVFDEWRSKVGKWTGDDTSVAIRFSVAIPRHWTYRRDDWLFKLVSVLSVPALGPWELFQSTGPGVGRGHDWNSLATQAVEAPPESRVWRPSASHEPNRTIHVSALGPARIGATAAAIALAEEVDRGITSILATTINHVLSIRMTIRESGGECDPPVPPPTRSDSEPDTPSASVERTGDPASATAEAARSAVATDTMVDSTVETAAFAPTPHKVSELTVFPSDCPDRFRNHMVQLIAGSEASGPTPSSPPAARSLVGHECDATCKLLRHPLEDFKFATSTLAPTPAPDVGNDQRCIWVGFTISHEQQGLAPEGPGDASSQMTRATLAALDSFLSSFGSIRSREFPSTPSEKHPNISYAIVRQGVDLDRVMGRFRVDIDFELTKRLLSAARVVPAATAGTTAYRPGSGADHANEELVRQTVGRFCSSIERDWRVRLMRALSALEDDAAKPGSRVGSNWSIEVEVVWRESWIGRYTSLLFRDI